ncbi:DgyrCDS4070 [Dimorphilus gyrociliatus]|uniref:DgyrCDS4070 n=1 Tax=Dimorphilus gyrociliatus TaxID=2664684 RepID=A0A7I8VH92_9ANNE|nr:DgyrCDS4070 [Dimorphilus gyrociliatus]
MQSANASSKYSEETSSKEEMNELRNAPELAADGSADVLGKVKDETKGEILKHGDEKSILLGAADSDQDILLQVAYLSNRHVLVLKEEDGEIITRFNAFLIQKEFGSWIGLSCHSERDIVYICVAAAKGIVIIQLNEDNSWQVILTKTFSISTSSELTCLDWIHEKNAIAFGTNCGRIHFLDVFQSSTIFENFGKGWIRAIKHCPYVVKNQLIAILCNRDSIHIVKFPNLHTFFSFNIPAVVCSMSWIPKLTTKESVAQLVTTCENNTLYVWKMFHHSPECEYNLRNKKGPWFPSLVIHNKAYGFIILVGDAKRTLSGFSYRSGSLKPIKDIGRYLHQSNPIKFIISAGNRIIVNRMFDKISFFDTNALKETNSLMTFAGFPYDYSYCPKNPSKLAIAGGDGHIRILRMNETRNEKLESKCPIKNRIISISWHPEEEQFVSFCTSDNRVVQYNLKTEKSIIIYLEQETICNIVSWAPSQGNKSKKIPLFFAIDGILHSVPFKEQKYKNIMTEFRASGLDDDTEFNCNCLAWKDRDYLAIGSTTGCVYVFDYPELKFRAKYKTHRQCINSIAWHPTTTSLNVKSPNSYLLGSASEDKTICIYDLKDILESCGENDPKTFTEAKYKLDLHNAGVNHLSWSIWDEAMFVSSSDDKSAQVWQLQENNFEPTANFRTMPGQALFSVFSQTCKNMIITSSTDCLLRSWRPSQQSHRNPPNTLEASKLKIKPPKPVPESKEESETGAQPVTSTKDENPLEIQASDGLGEKPDANTQTQVDEDFISELENIVGKQAIIDAKKYRELQHKEELAKGTKEFKIEPKVKFRLKSLLPESGTKENNRSRVANLEDCIYLARCIYLGENLPKQLKYLGLYLDRPFVIEALREEIKYHISQKNWDHLWALHAFKGTLPQAVAFARSKEIPRETLMFLSLVNSSKWSRTVINDYCKDLNTQGSYYLAAAFLTTAGLVEEAVKTLYKRGLFKDAICLGRLQWSKNNSNFINLIDNYAQQLRKAEKYELSAKCYISLKRPEEAACMLSKIGTVTSLRIETVLFGLSGHEKQYATRINSLTQSVMTEFKWKEMLQVYQVLPEKCFPHIMVVSCHETILKVMHRENAFKLNEKNCSFTFEVDENIADMTTFGLEEGSGSDGEDKGCLPARRLLVDKDVPFIIHVTAIWKSLCISFDKLTDAYTILNELAKSKQAFGNEKQTLAAIGLYTTLTILALLRDDKPSAFYWVLESERCCYKAGCTQILSVLNRLLFIKGYELFFDIKDSLLKIINEPITKENESDYLNPDENAKINQLKKELYPFIAFTSLLDEDQKEDCDQNEPIWLKGNNQNQCIIKALLNKRDGRLSVLKKYLTQIETAIRNLVHMHKQQNQNVNDQDECLTDSGASEFEIDKKENADDKLIDHTRYEHLEKSSTEVNSVKGRSQVDNDLEGAVKIESGNDKGGETDVTVEEKFIGEGMDYDNKPGVDALKKNDTDYAKPEEVVRTIEDKNNGESVKAECSKIDKCDKDELKFEQLPKTNREEGSNNGGRPPVTTDSIDSLARRDSAMKDESANECKTVPKEKILTDDVKSEKNCEMDKCPIKIEERESKPSGEKTTSEIEDQTTTEVVKQTKSGAIDENLDGNLSGLQEPHQSVKEKISFEKYLESCNYFCLCNNQKKYEEEIEELLKEPLESIPDSLTSATILERLARKFGDSQLMDIVEAWQKDVYHFDQI